MQSLLRWGIENYNNRDDSGTGADSLTQRTNLDPGIIDAILGRPDSELMKEALAKAHDASLDESARLTALDDLEMLVENIDNANDLERLNMWEPLQALLLSPSDDVKTQAMWVIGTAVQNNPAAQKAYLALDPLPSLLSHLSPSPRSSQQLRSKAIYALSGLLKHNAAAMAPFDAAAGWDALRGALSDSDISVRRKAAFLLNSLLVPSAAPGARIHGGGPPVGAPVRVHPNSHASMVADPASAETAPETLRALRAHRLLPVVVRELTEPTPYGPDGDEGNGRDADLEEKLTRCVRLPGLSFFFSLLCLLCRLLHTYVSAHNGAFDGPETNSLGAFLSARRAKPGEGELGLDADELQVLENALV
ncbi:Fes1-domain-containing protein [Russula earlei]|uniref:Fes1-domain-containing protein n=1 Tax=Russula earlei TaxID=71964 RepID=A0ACC0TWY2_9AGAM|nr:Fes1-domain-containing protein [Russula earlei]